MQNMYLKTNNHRYRFKKNYKAKDIEKTLEYD